MADLNLNFAKTAVLSMGILRVIVLKDCYAAFSEEADRVSLHIMDHLATLATSADFLQSV